MAFDNYKSPRVPAPPEQYNQGYFSQLVRNLTSYFNIVDSDNGISTRQISPNILQLPVTELGVTPDASNNLNNLKVPSYTFIRLTSNGVTANFDITGIDSGYTNSNQLDSITNDGRMLILYNSTGYNMAINHQDTNSLANNRIETFTGSAINNAHIATLIYSVSDLRWLVVSHQP